MLCPKCKRNTVKNHRTYDSDYLKVRRSVMVCEHESCDYKSFYVLQPDQELEYSVENHLIYKEAYRIMCEILNRAAVELQEGETYFSKCSQMSLELSEIKQKEKLEELRETG